MNNILGKKIKERDNRLIQDKSIVDYLNGDKENKKFSIEEVNRIKPLTNILDDKLILNLPNEHFISKYTKWMSSITDGYYEYQVMSALWLLSAITQGKVELALKQETISPNLWFTILGTSTISRKSTIVNKTRSIYEEATKTVLYNDEFSLEGYLETLSDEPINNFVRDEAAGLMAKQHRSYNEGIFEMECAVYDGQNIKKTLASGGKKQPKVFEINDPYVTKLYSTTSDSYSRYMTIDDFTSGYGYRFLFTNPKYKNKKKDIEIETEDDISIKNEVLESIKEYHILFNSLDWGTKFTITKEAIRYYNDILHELEKKAEECNNEIYNSAIGRNQIHILKVAMLIEIGKSKPNFEITLDSIKVAANIVLDHCLPCIMDTIKNLQEDGRINNIEKITILLRKSGGKLAHSKLLHDVKIKSTEFKQCIDTMIESETIKKIKVDGSKATYYVLLNDS